MENLLIFEIAQTFNYQRNLIEKSMNEIGLHTGQISVLNSLWKTDGQNQAELSKNLQVTAPTVFNTVSRMAEADLIEIRKCENDARSMRVFLTEKGRSLQKKAEKQWLDLEEKTFANWAETEKMMFSLLLKKFKKSE